MGQPRFSNLVTDPAMEETKETHSVVLPVRAKFVPQSQPQPPSGLMAKIIRKVTPMRTDRDYTNSVEARAPSVQLNN